MPVSQPTTTHHKQWYDQRLGALALWLAAWALGASALLYALGSASMWAYLAFIVLFIFGLNRFVRAIRGR